MSDESIELPITKPKRTYTKRTKTEPQPSVVPNETPLEVVPDISSIKPKRTYTKKIKTEPQPTTVVLPETISYITDIHELVKEPYLREKTIMDDTPPTSPIAESIPLKKPRTEKQLAAFEKMRSARALKQNELNDLKQLEKTQRQLETEQRKLDTVTEKVLAKATELKTKRVSKKKVVIEDDGYRTEPESIIREQKYKPIVFM